MNSKRDLGLIQSLWNAGKSFTQIAERLGGGISRSAVAGLIFRMRRHGLECVHRSSANNNPRKPRTTQRTVRARRAPASLPAKPASRGREVRPPLNPPPPASLGVSFFDLRPHHCRAIYDDGTYCGRRIEKSSWCRHHARVYLHE